MVDTRHPQCLFIDAMGVLYASGDDVVDLLVPFCREKGSTLNGEEILRVYVDCSLGKFSSTELWNRLGLNQNWDEEYMQRYSLNPGVPETLALLKGKGYRLYCLSNDVMEWSLLLRKRFSLEGYFGGWIVSGEVGIRKPDPGIYDTAMEIAGAGPGECLLLDDRVENLKAAREKGMKVLKFGEVTDGEVFRGPWVASFQEIPRALNDLTKKTV
jgi:HAD superfamily hydrolase (TIGR01509 family)